MTLVTKQNFCFPPFNFNYDHQNVINLNYLFSPKCYEKKQN